MSYSSFHLPFIALNRVSTWKVKPIKSPIAPRIIKIDTSIAYGSENDPT
ncbi:MAG: hypothetical protein U9Q92_03225 [archaeon]|nr:hypothetical protein [archaeon]